VTGAGAIERLVPASVRELPGGLRRLARIFGVALAIRLVLMPIACHADLISTYHRSYLLLERTVARWWVPHELLQALVLKLASPFLPLSELLAWKGRSTVTNDFWIEQFVTHPSVHLALFVFKLPYLLCDLGVALVLLHLFAEAPRRALRAASFWLMSPITIFAFYIFARHDVIAILFLALAVLGLRRGRDHMGALSLGVSIWSRYYAFVLLPFLVALHPGRWLRKASVLAVALAPVVAYNGLTQVITGRKVPPGVLMVARSGFSEYLLGLKFDMGSNQLLYVFPTLYALLFLYAASEPARQPLHLRFARYALCATLAMYTVSFFHPHYLSWMVVFMVILRVELPDPLLDRLYYLLVALLVPYTFYWGEPLAGWLFAPLAPDFFIGLPSPWSLIREFGDALVPLNLVRTFITATCLFVMGWTLFGPGRAEASAAPVPAADAEGAPTAPGVAG
jgi:hypothetical protein